MMARAFIRTSLLILGVAGGCAPPTSLADATEGSYVIPGSKAADLESCVRETGFMRRNHMELIEHQRDVTVHEGIRATTDSLAGCIDCHVSYDQQQQPVSVYSNGQFCNTCHEFAAVNLDCFGCHSTVPMPLDTTSDDQVPHRMGGAAAAPGGSGAEVAEVRGGAVLREVEQEVGE